jgi:opacity protein-like surface antigen
MVNRRLTFLRHGLRGSVVKDMGVMGWLRKFGATGLLLVAQILAAAAADMPDTLPPPRSQWRPPPALDLNAGWYLRGDLGYAWGSIESAEAAPGFTSPTDSKLGNGMTGAGGVGIKTKWLRTDVTIDYLAPLKYDGMIGAPGDVTTKISAVSALFNGYLDLGTWYRMTPYIGAGAGVGYVSVIDYASTLAPPFTADSHHQWNFAWAAMLGMAYTIAPNLQVDFGYRYLHFGDVTTASDNFGAMNFKNIAAHEVRVGLRWSLDDLAER